jgi:hypothetical protein
VELCKIQSIKHTQAETRKNGELINEQHLALTELSDILENSIDIQKAARLDATRETPITSLTDYLNFSHLKHKLAKLYDKINPPQ